MQVPALDIFDKGQNSGVLLIDLHFQTRNCLQSRQLGCPEAALSRYQLPAIIPAADGQGLDDPVAADGFRQFRQRSGSEFPSGLVGVGSDLLHRKPTDLRVQHARHLLTGSETAGVPGSACIVAPGSGGNVGKSVGKLKENKKAQGVSALFCRYVITSALMFDRQGRPRLQKPARPEKLMSWESTGERQRGKTPPRRGNTGRPVWLLRNCSASRS